MKKKIRQNKINALRPKFMKAISAFGDLYNGFEVHGMEKIPKKGPAMLVFYHGLMPLDIWYLGSKIYLETGRLPRGMADYFLFDYPVLQNLMELVKAIPGTHKSAVKMLKRGEIIGVCPGGVREAISGTKNDYKLLWENRLGFAKVAIETNVPILPGFTENIESLYKSLLADSNLLQKLYNITRLPLVPIIGLGPLPFPVKLRTWIGNPIRPRKNETPEALAKRTKKAIERLIDQHQDPESTVLLAIKENLSEWF